MKRGKEPFQNSFNSHLNIMCQSLWSETSFFSWVLWERNEVWFEESSGINFDNP